MRRGLLKDLANTPTQIVCGWRLYGPDTVRLRALSGETIVIDLLSGNSTVGGAALDPPLAIAQDLTAWINDRFARDSIPAGLVLRAAVTLRPSANATGSIAVDCTTLVETTRGRHTSQAVARWHHEDIDGV